MRKILIITLYLVAALMMAACQKNENENVYKEQILGKWKSYSANGKLDITDRKFVNTYYADGTIKETLLNEGSWICSQSCTYKIVGNEFSRTRMDGGTVTATIASITDTYFTLKDCKYSSGFVDEESIYEKVNVDYSQPFVGLWEGVEMTGDETYGAENHRWKYNTDGTYVYFTKNAQGQWESDPSNTGNTYYVDGNFFGSRWLKDGTEYREWWDIEYCNDTEMKWSALREKSDSSLFTTTITMKRVNE